MPEQQTRTALGATRGVSHRHFFLASASLATLLLHLWTLAPAAAAPNYALSFNGTNQYVSATLPALASNYTVSAWAWLRCGGNYDTSRVGLLTGSINGNSVEFLIRSETADAADPQYLELGRFGDFSGEPSASPVPLNQWVHVAITVTSNKLVSYFVNGNAAGSWDASGLNLAIGPAIHLGSDNAGRHFDGLLDEVRIWSVACSRADIQAGMNRAPNVTDPNLAAYWPFNEGTGTATTADASGHGHTGTLVNTPIWSPSGVLVAPAGPGAYALSFDGVNDYVETGTAIIPASGDFTVECWVTCPTAPNSHREILSQGGMGNAFYIGTDPANNFRLGDHWSGTGVAFPLGGWHHVAVVKSSTNTILYINGTNRISRGSAIGNPAASGLRFGRQYGYDVTEYWPGSLDDVRIWSRALSAAEIETNRTQMPTGLEAGLLAAWSFDEGANALCTSIGAKKITGTLIGGVTWTGSGVPWTLVPADFALSFKGSSSYLDAGMAVIPTNGDFTVECWAFLPTTASGYLEMLSQGSAGTANAFYIGTDAANNLRLGDAWNTVSPAVPFPKGGWHHFAVVKSSTDTVFYLDGTSRASKGSAIANPTAGTGFRLGRQYGDQSEYWPGSLDDVRIWSRALSASEIQTTFTLVPTANEPGLVAAWEFNEGAGVTTSAIGSTNIVLRMTNGVTWMPSGVVWLPAIVTQPTGVAAVAGAAAQLSVLATTDRWPLSYQWYRQNCGAIAGATNATLSWSSLAASNAGIYYVVVSNSQGSVASSHIALTVQFITRQPTNVASLVGAAAQLSVVAADVVPVSYQWYWQSHGAIAGATNATLAWSRLAASNAGAYYVVVQNAFGTNYSRPALVNAVNWQLPGADPAPHLIHTPFTDPGATLISPVAAVAAGYGHCLAVRTDGSVVAWGNDLYGQTELPASATNAVAVAAGKYHSLVLKADGSVVAWGQNYYGQTSVPASATNVVAIAAGDYHSLAVRADGTVVGWGNNNGGQTDMPASVSDVVAVTAGENHNVALKSDGMIVAWGWDGNGQTSVPPSATNIVAVAARLDRSLALKADGHVLVWGVNPFGPKDAPPAATNVVAIAAGDYHSVAARADGSVVAWGHNGFQQTNVPTSVANVVAVAAGYNYCLGLKRDGSVVAWGGNTDGANNYTGQLNVPPLARTLMPSSGTVNPDVAGTYTLTYSFTDGGGSVFTAQRTVVVGFAPEIASQPASITAPVGAPAQLSVVATGLVPISYQWYWKNRGVIAGATNATLSWSSLAASNAGAYFVICRNAFGPSVSRLALVSPVVWHLHGDNPLTNVIHASFTDPGATQTTPIAAIAAGESHSLALKADGTVVGWGRNDSGEASAPASATNVISVGGGQNRSVALKADGTVIAWGDTTYSWAAVPAAATNIVSLAAGAWHNLALKADGAVIGWGYNDDGETDVPASASNAVAIAAGSWHGLALKADGTVIAWGYNNSHQTEVPAAAANSVAVAGGGFHSLALKADGTVIGWGDNSSGQTTAPASATNVVAIAAGWDFSMALKADGTVVAWGSHNLGQTTVPASATGVVAIAAGGWHALALKADGTVIAWGLSDYGQASVPSWTQDLLATSGAVNPDLAGTYTLTYSFTNGWGDVVSTNRTVVVWQAVPDHPILTDLPIRLDAWEGSPAHFTIAASGTPPLFYQWHSQTHEAIAGAANATLAWSAVTTQDTGQYSVLVSNVYGRATSTVASLTVHVPPVIGGLANLEVSLGASASFQAVMSDSRTLLYQWQHNGTNLPAGTSPGLSFTPVTGDDLGDYRLIVTIPGTDLSVTSSVVALDIARPPSLVGEPADAVAFSGTPARLMVSATGSAPLSYRWYQTNGAVLTATNAALAWSSASISNAGAYWVIVSNACGMATSRVATLTVWNSPASRAVPTGTQVSLATSLPEGASLSFQWQREGTNLPAQIIRTVAGNGIAEFAGDGGLAINAGFRNIPGLAVDAAGNLYLSDTVDQRVRQVGADGKIHTVAGTGVAGFNGDGQLATQSLLWYPQGVALDAAGNLVIADTGNQRVRRVGPDGLLTTVVGGGGDSSDGVWATEAYLQSPQSLAFDAVGNLFITDMGSRRVRQLTPDGRLRTAAGNGGFSSSGDPTRATNTAIINPSAMTISVRGDFFVVDSGIVSGKPLPVEADLLYGVASNGVIRLAGGQGTNYTSEGIAATNARLVTVSGLALDAAGNLYLSESYLARIRRIGTNGLVQTIAGNGSEGFSGDGGAALLASLSGPTGLACDRAGNLFFSDAVNARIRQVVNTDRAQLAFANASAADAGNYRLVVSNLASGLCFTSAVASVTLADPPQIVTQPTGATNCAGMTATFSVSAEGTGPLSYRWYRQGSGLVATGQILTLTNLADSQAGVYFAIVTNAFGAVTSSPARLTMVASPRFLAQPQNLDLAAGATGVLVARVTGGGPFAYQWQHDGTNLPHGIISTLTNVPAQMPIGMALDAAGNLFVADGQGHRVYRHTPGGLVTVVAGTGVAGFSGDNVPATNARLSSPYWVALDAAGNLFISDTGTNRVRKVATNGIITTVAGMGPPAFFGDGSPATNAMLNVPAGLAFDASGALFIGDAYNNRIRKIATNGIITTVAGNGVGAYAGDGGLATLASLAFPILALPDATGSLYVADMGNHCVRRINASGVITTVAGNTVGAFAGDWGTATNASLKNPVGLGLDAAGNLYIADMQNHRVRRVDADGVIATVAGNGNSGNTGDGGPALNAAIGTPMGLLLDRAGGIFISSQQGVRKVTSLAGPVLTLNSGSSNTWGNYRLVVTSLASGVSITSAVAVVSQPRLRILIDERFGFLTNRFGFNMTSPTNQSVVVEATTNLGTQVWTPLKTNSIGTNAVYFSDPGWQQFPTRIYRLRTSGSQ